jgi:hypothetical protein
MSQRGVNRHKQDEVRSLHGKLHGPPPQSVRRGGGAGAARGQSDVGCIARVHGDRSGRIGHSSLPGLIRV